MSDDLISRQAAIEKILGQPPEAHYPSWYARQIEDLPPAPPEYLAEQAGILVTDTDTISRKAAIDLIESYPHGIWNLETMDDMVNMVRQLPPANSSEIPNNSDCISRQAAINAIEGLCNECDHDSTWCGDCRISHPDKDAKDVLEALPPIKVATDINVGDKDTISRQAAIEALNKLSESTYEVNYGAVDCDDAIGKIKQLPPAQPERIKGHWIFDFAHNEMTCSECGLTFTGGFDLENADNFCRHCGSDMR